MVSALPIAVPIAVLAALAVGVWQVLPAGAQAPTPIILDGEISDSDDVDLYPLLALAGESFALSLERITLPAAELSVWKPAVGEESARRVARVTSGEALHWTATESGAWRVRVRGLRGAVGRYRLWIQPHSDAVGASLSEAKLGVWQDDGTLIERSQIDYARDVDWFAVPLAAGNRYTVWSVLGGIGGLSASLREPGAEEFRELAWAGSAVSETFVAESDGSAVLAVRGREQWMYGSYAVGVTRLGMAVEPTLELPAREVSLLNVRGDHSGGLPRRSGVLVQGRLGSDYGFQRTASLDRRRPGGRRGDGVGVPAALE